MLLVAAYLKGNGLLTHAATQKVWAAPLISQG